MLDITPLDKVGAAYMSATKEKDEQEYRKALADQHILRKISSVKSEVRGSSPDFTLDDGTIIYSADFVTDLVDTQLDKHGLAVTTEIIDIRVMNGREFIKMKFTITDLETGHPKVFEWSSSSGGEFSTGSAVTLGLKSFYRTTFGMFRSEIGTETSSAPNLPTVGQVKRAQELDQAVGTHPKWKEEYEKAKKTNTRQAFLFLIMLGEKMEKERK